MIIWYTGVVYVECNDAAVNFISVSLSQSFCIVFYVNHHHMPHSFLDTYGSSTYSIYCYLLYYLQIVGYKGAAVVVVSCVTKDRPFRAHPHSLVGKEGCKRGICTVPIKEETMTASFCNLGIQCVKKKDIEEALKIREEIRVDPFRSKYPTHHMVSLLQIMVSSIVFSKFFELYVFTSCCVIQKYYQLIFNHLVSSVYISLDIIYTKNIGVKTLHILLTLTTLSCKRSELLFSQSLLMNAKQQ